MPDIIDREFQYEGFHGRQAICRLRMSRNGDTALVVWSELDNNPGTSVTNAAESLAALVVATYDLNPFKCLFIEHYPAKPDKFDPQPDSYSIVEFQWELRQHSKSYVAKGPPDWTHLPEEKAAELLVRFKEAA